MNFVALSKIHSLAFLMNLHTATLNFTRNSMNYYPELRPIIKIEYHKSPVKASLSNTPPLPTFQGKKVNKPLSLLTPPPPFLPPYYWTLINDGLYLSITTVKLHLDWSRMVYSPAESTDLFLIIGCMTSNFLTWAFPLCILVLYGELIPLSLLNKIRPPSLKYASLKCFEINKSREWGWGGLNRGFT